MGTAGKGKHAAQRGNVSVQYYLVLKLTILILGVRNMGDWENVIWHNRNVLSVRVTSTV
jgi:hypothetical protein